MIAVTITFAFFLRVDWHYSNPIC